MINRTKSDVAFLILEGIPKFKGQSNSFCLWFKFDKEFNILINPLHPNVKMSRIKDSNNS